MAGSIAYRKGFRYQLEVDHKIQIDVRPATDIVTSFIELTKEGLLTVKYGYSWDGASGPAIDTKSIQRAALVHDALYQLLREGHLGQEYREPADRVFRKIYQEDAKRVAEAYPWWMKIYYHLVGRWLVWARARWVYRGVRMGGASSADPENDKPIYYAP